MVLWRAPVLVVGSPKCLCAVGIFNLGFFTFEMIMYILMAVMITDVILLDFYNTLGLPTSTTVSLVFELLGSALAIGLLVSFNSGNNGFSQVLENN